MNKVQSVVVSQQLWLVSPTNFAERPPAQETSASARFLLTRRWQMTTPHLQIMRSVYTEFNFV